MVSPKGPAASNAVKLKYANQIEDIAKTGQGVELEFSAGNVIQVDSMTVSEPDSSGSLDPVTVLEMVLVNLSPHPWKCSSLRVEFVESAAETTPSRRRPGDFRVGGSGRLASRGTDGTDGGNGAGAGAGAGGAVVTYGGGDGGGPDTGSRGSPSAGSFGVSLDDTYIDEDEARSPSPSGSAPVTISPGVALTPDPLGARAFGLPPEMLQTTPVSAVDLNSPVENQEKEPPSHQEPARGR